MKFIRARIALAQIDTAFTHNGDAARARELHEAVYRAVQRIEDAADVIASTRPRQARRKRPRAAGHRDASPTPPGADPAALSTAPTPTPGGAEFEDWFEPN